MKHPTQKIVDSRFVANDIVRYLLDNGGIDLNQIAVLPFSKEDIEHFYQLIGYSLSGYSELSEVSNDSYDKAISLEENPTYTDSQAEIEVLKGKLTETRALVKKLATGLFHIHEDDLVE